jgi:hypothetical protein
MRVSAAKGKASLRMLFDASFGIDQPPGKEKLKSACRM